MSSSSFRHAVLAVVRRIPVGRIATYGDVARAAGRPRAWRAVGSIMRTCGDPGIPCHRVIASGGRLGGYGGNVALKRALLQAEGLTIAGGRVRQFDAVRWPGKPPRLADARNRRGGGTLPDRSARNPAGGHPRQRW